MADHLSKERRSWNMSRIKSANTKPEIVVRKLLHSMGFRFRLNGRVSKRTHPKGILPGKPDIVLAGYKTVIFVHGCFWHRHENCKDATVPKTRKEWWLEKLNRNVERDKIAREQLNLLGWKVIVVWECETALRYVDNLTKTLNIEILNDRL